MRGLPQDRAVIDLKAGSAYLATRKDVDHDHIGSIGWCMGGGYALQLAIHEPHLAACVVNYGALPTDPNDIQQIFAPVLGSFGANDRGITPADVQGFEKTMRGMNRRIDVKFSMAPGTDLKIRRTPRVTGRTPQPMPGRARSRFLVRR